MCFCIRNSEQSITRWVALQDITCYKILNKDLSSIVKGFKYELNKIYKRKLKYPELKLEKNNHKIKTIYNLEKGFHSYSTIIQLNSSWSDFWLDVEIKVKCIIPKGSEFYYDPVGKEYISNQIIIKKIIK